MSLQPKSVLAWPSLWIVVLLAFLLTRSHRFPQFRGVPPGNGVGGTNSRAAPNGLGNSGKETSKAAVVAGLVRMLTTPITFHGTVVDQFGLPVPGAEVGYSLLDNFNASGSTGKTQADQNGRIRISGVRGAVITVGVAKPGYYGVEGKSALSFAYGTAPDEYRMPPPTEESPAIFQLHKKGTSASLLHTPIRNHKVPKNGTPVRVQLTTGLLAPEGELMVEAWTSERKPKGPRFYDWRCRISIPGGGITPRNDPLDFTAPTVGYTEFVEVLCNDSTEQWAPRLKQDYFIRLQDGRHARIHFFFTPGGQHFFHIETYLNQKSGDRNLEFDENNQWQP